MNKLTKLFSTPQKAVISVICIAAAFFLLGAGAVFASSMIAGRSDAGPDESSAILQDNTQTEAPAAAQDNTQTGTLAAAQTNKEQISLDDAKKAALSDAGLSSSDVTYTKEKSDYEDGRSVYDIEFYTSAHKYEYEIDAVTGDIYDKSVESFSGVSRRSEGSADSNAYISEDEAKAAAVTHAGFSAADVTFSKTELDREDGQIVYEIEFYQGGREYEYTINAVTGDVMEYEID